MKTFQEFVTESTMKGQDGKPIKVGDKVEIAKYDGNKGSADFSDSSMGIVKGIEKGKFLVYSDGETELTDAKNLKKA